MDDDFVSLLEKQKLNLQQRNIWDNKITRYFDGFAYLNSEDLISQHIKKLTHVGINSINQSTELIRLMTINNLDMIDNNLKKVIAEVGQLTSTFDKLNEVFNYKPGFFNKKTNGEVFLEFFNLEKDNITQKINNLNVKQHNLIDAKKDIETSMTDLLDAYLLLDRDLTFLKQAEKYMEQDARLPVKQVFNDYSFEILSVKTDLLTQQQIIFQKYGAMNILMQNLLNCHKNISYLTRTTNSCLFNLVELQHILHLSNDKNSDQEKSTFAQIKESLSKVSNDLKTISQRPFAALIN